MYQILLFEIKIWQTETRLLLMNTRLVRIWQRLTTAMRQRHLSERTI